VVARPIRRRRRWAPLWVYLFGLFAVATAQRLLFPPAEHTVAANVAFFAIVGAIVVAVLTAIQRRT
jgi:hypothetical protein